MIWNDKQITAELKEIREELNKKPDKIQADAYERIADLEVKMSKLWNLLLETSERTGKVKPTRFGRMFGGQLRK